MMRVRCVFFLILMSGCIGVAQEFLSKDSSGYEIQPDAATEGWPIDTKFDPTKMSGLLIPEEDLSEGRKEKGPAPSSSSTNKVNENVHFLISAGLEYSDEGEYEAAERAYLRALEKDSESAELLFRLSTLYTMMGRFEEAIEILNRQVELFPENPLLHNNISWCYATEPRVRNAERALWHAREALLFAPYQSVVWNTLAEAYFVSGEYQQALRCSEHALDLLSSDNPSEDQVESYEEQRTRILRALDAMKMLEELSAGE